MSRIQTLTTSEADTSTKALYGQVQAKLGRVPNLMLTLGHSAAALGGYLQFNEALSQGILAAKDRERIALAVAEYNGCEYCLAAHSAIGKMVGLNLTQVLESRAGHADDPKADSLLRFVNRVLDSRGQVNDDDLEDIVDAGYSDAEVAEIVGHISLSVLTNYFNNVAQTEVDFPKVEALAV